MLFNKNGNGSLELQLLTGNFAAANNYDAVESEVLDATRTVRGLVGNAVVSRAELAYAAGTDDALTTLVRTAVAILATARYSRSNLVTHEDSGSKVRVDENEKVPWEWMIDRDERAQQDRWYRALDALYAWLDTNQPTEWTGSDQYRRSRKSIIRSLSDFEAVYPTDGSYYVYHMLQNLVIECQPRLKKLIGDEKWALITAATVADDDLELLQICQRWAVLSALVKAVRRWSLEVFPLAIVRRFCPSYQGGRSKSAATREEMDAYVASLEDQIGDAQEEIAELLADGNPWEDHDPQPRNHPSNKFFTAQ